MPAALLSPEFQFLAVNRPLVDLLRLSAAQLRRRTLFDVIDERDRDGLRSFTEQVAQMRSATRAQREVRLVTGQQALTILQRAGRGRDARVMINIVDVSDLSGAGSDRAALLQQIEHAAWEWRRTFDSVEMPIVIVGAELAVVRINRAARMLAGKTYGEIIGTSLRDFPADEPWVSLAALTRQVQEGRAPAARQVRDAAGRTLDLLAMLFNAEDAGDDRVIVIAWDVSALVDLQARLEQQRQMATMGALVAGVAHEVRNPLFAISATIDALEQKATPELSEYFEVLREEIDRMTTLMQDLLAYGRPAAPQFAAVSVLQIVERAARGSAAVANRNGVEIVVDVASDLSVVADADRLGRAVENLIMNAIQHSAPESKVSVAGSSGRSGKSGMVSIAIRDRGPGFAPTDLPRIFEPFFSRRKGGTGLGLALVHQIVSEHGGEVRAANREGGGAEVVISIPEGTARRAT